jgi:uncharacterized protein YchJ
MDKKENRKYLMRKSIDISKDEKGKTLYSFKVKRNQLCPCGSGKKYKICCIKKVEHNNPFRELSSETVKRMTHARF